MDINISGRKMNVGDALSEHVTGRLTAVTDKYFNRSMESSVTFSKENHLIRSLISLHANQGITLQAKDESADAYGAFEGAAEKIEKQLRRYKRRLKNHHHQPSRDIAQELARNTVIAPEPADGDDLAADDAADDQPIIIAESDTEIPTASVGDAVMRMDLADVPVLMFRNAKTKRLEVVYRRDDGNIGWISPPPG